MQHAHNLEEGLSQILDSLTREGVGKRTRSDLYAHRSLVDIYAADMCPELLSQLDALWRRWAPGGLDAWNILRLSARADSCALLCYPSFDDAGHPALTASLKLTLRDPESQLGIDPRFSDYREHSNPPILHRKELFVAPDHPLARTFSELTQAELAAGMLDQAHTVGYRRQWEARLTAAGLAVQGHQLKIVERAP